MERIKAGTQKISPNGLSLRTQSKYKNNKQNMVPFYNIWKKYNKIQLTINKMYFIKK